ncbi:MAG: hypothetical protein QM741_10710 [Rudaea sp.]|uniref:hypothetical protein n=1 Tax=Rudaea sp. TaxID=2136325 RepID=UPI0039E5EED9
MAAGPNLRGQQWHRQPVVWLAIALFAAIVAGCISMIVLGARHADEPLPNVGEQVFKVPVSRPPPAEKN